jgi:hypothetical protein
MHGDSFSPLRKYSSPTAANRQLKHFPRVMGKCGAAALIQAGYFMGQLPPIKIGGMDWLFQEIG